MLPQNFRNEKEYFLFFWSDYFSIHQQKRHPFLSTTCPAFICHPAIESQGIILSIRCSKTQRSKSMSTPLPVERKAILWLGTYLSSLEWQPCRHINNPREAELQNCHSADSLTSYLLFWGISSWIKAHQHLLSCGALILLVKIQCSSILWFTTALSFH